MPTSNSKSSEFVVVAFSFLFLSSFFGIYIGVFKCETDWIISTFIQMMGGARKYSIQPEANNRKTKCWIGFSLYTIHQQMVILRLQYFTFVISLFHTNHKFSLLVILDTKIIGILLYFVYLTKSLILKKKTTKIKRKNTFPMLCQL